MFYVFHGDDHLTQAEELAALREKMGDPTMAELNTTHLDGRKTTLDELRLQCDTLPFMADRRLIIVEGMLGGTGNSGAEKQLLEDLVEFLPNLPPSTRLVFLEDKPLSRRHPVLSLAQESDTGYAKRFVCPTGTALVRWVKRRAKQEGGEIDDGAAQTLAALVSDDLALLVQEIRKLVTYTGGQRPIAEEDIALLTPHARQVSIFDMVDALGRRDGKTAIQLYHDLLAAGEHPLALLGMITRQFRLMIQVKELAPKFVTPERIARELKQKAYPIKKVLAQSRNYSMEQLHQVYHKILDIDIEIKTGNIAPDLALDTLIAGLSRVP